MDALLTVQVFFYVLFISVQCMIDFYNPVAFCFMANTSQWTAIAVCSLVTVCGLCKARFGFCLMRADVLHVLTHRTDIVIFFFIVIKCIGCKGMLFMFCAALVFVKPVILYIVLYMVIHQVL